MWENHGEDQLRVRHKGSYILISVMGFSRCCFLEVVSSFLQNCAETDKYFQNLK